MIISDVSSGNGRQPVADLLDIIKRRRMMLVVPVLAGIGVGFAGYLTAPVSYVSESVLVLDMRRLQALKARSRLSSAFIDTGKSDVFGGKTWKTSVS